MKPLILIFTFFLPLIAAAQLTYEPLVTLPLVSGSGFDAYINSVYALSISIAALLAVIKIIVAGVKWMTTDVVTSKGDAKKDIQGALLGLLVVLSAVLIITVINPDITNVSIAPINTGATPFAPGGGAPTLTTAVTNNGVYDSIPSSAGPQQVAAFEATCTSPRTFAIQDSLARCYNTAAGETVTRTTICSSRQMARNGCSGAVTNATNRCTSELSGSFVQDPTASNMSICIYTP